MFQSVAMWRFAVLIAGYISHCLAEATTPLEVVQAQVPPRKSFENAACEQVLFQHTFANSYGTPYVGTYTPPQNCDYTTTIFNISVTSAGRQYDRLALLFIGDTEVWRTSTAMPITTGIHWSYTKDLTAFSSLLSKPQPLVFSLDNVYSSLYTGAFNVTLSALYYNDKYTSLSPASAIYPISALSSALNTSSVFSVPSANASVSLTLPRNIKKAVVSVLASGNGAEEFWYTNVPSTYINTFPSNPGWLYGYSPFREIQLLIDGQLAGVNWPFPLLFTGGVDPGLWRPIAGIGAYDLPNFEIDVTPWLGSLCDGRSHSFEIKVVGYDETTGELGEVGQNWYVGGAVFIWLDSNSNQTTGTAVKTVAPPPTFSFHPKLATTSNGTNSSFYFSLTAHRTLSLASTITTSSGSQNASWAQDLSFSNIQNMTSEAFNQSLSMLTNGSFSSNTGGTNTYTYPLNLYSAYIIAPSVATLSSVFALVDRSLRTSGVDLLGGLSGVKGEEEVKTRQVGENFYAWNETIVEGVGEGDRGVTEQWYSYEGGPGRDAGPKEYSRKLKEVDGSWVEDEESWTAIEVPETVALPYVEGEPVV